MSDTESSNTEQDYLEKEKLLCEIDRFQSEIKVHIDFFEDFVDDLVPWKIETGELENLRKISSTLREAVKIFRELNNLITLKPSDSKDSGKN